MTSSNHPALGVVILGAGASVRMGKPKLLLPWQDTTVIGQIISIWRDLGAVQITIVMRQDDAALTVELDRLAFPVSDRILNPQPERGMFSSILCAAGWTGWRREISNWAVVLGDQPHLLTEMIRQLLEFSACHPGAICQPEFGGHRRHPVLLPQSAFSELARTGTKNLKDFLNQTACQSVKCSMNDAGLSLDMDTPEDYIRLQSR